jgi:hypothetical protein
LLNDNPANGQKEGDDPPIGRVCEVSPEDIHNPVDARHGQVAAM